MDRLKNRCRTKNQGMRYSICHGMSQFSYITHDICQFAPHIIILKQPLLCLQFLDLIQPDASAGIGRHTQISPWGNCNATHFRAIRQTGSFKLLGKISPVKGLQPLQYHFIRIFPSEGLSGNTIYFGRFKALTKHIV